MYFLKYLKLAFINSENNENKVQLSEMWIDLINLYK